MKKKRVFWGIAVAVVLAAAAAAVCLLLVRALRQAEADQAAVYRQYADLTVSVRDSTLTVREQGAVVGVYTLEDLGLLPAAQAAVDTQFGGTDRMDPAEFAALPVRERLDWSREVHPRVSSAAPDVSTFTSAAVRQDLDRVPRADAQDAFVYFSDGAYCIQPEVPGNVLREGVVEEALAQCLSGLTLTAGQPAALTLELTDFDCYLPPAVTADSEFDFEALLEDALGDLRLEIRFHDRTEVLEGETLTELVTVGRDGILRVQEDALDGRIAAWAEAFAESDTPYLFSSYVDGVVPISFLPCDYRVDTDTLRNALTEALLRLTGVSMDAPYFCTDLDGEPFAIGDTYVEVDIGNQQLSYFRDGGLVITTPVVTGRPDGHQTPTGLYAARNKETDCWLTGPDFNVFVKYWVGIFDAYGLHDASWRSNFGGDYYVNNGSHGCVNIPEEAMAVLFDDIEVGTPVLIYE